MQKARNEQRKKKIREIKTDKRFPTKSFGHNIYESLINICGLRICGILNILVAARNWFCDSFAVISGCKEHAIRTCTLAGLLRNLCEESWENTSCTRYVYVEEPTRTYPEKSLRNAACLCAVCALRRSSISCRWARTAHARKERDPVTRATCQVFSILNLVSYVLCCHSYRKCGGMIHFFGSRRNKKTRELATGRLLLLLCSWYSPSAARAAEMPGPRSSLAAAFAGALRGRWGP